MSRARFAKLVAAAQRQHRDGRVIPTTIEQLAQTAGVDVTQVQTLVSQAKWGQLATLYVDPPEPVVPQPAPVPEPTMEERIAALEERLSALEGSARTGRRAVGTRRGRGT